MKRSVELSGLLSQAVPFPLFIEASDREQTVKE